jgi:hypothetical protein
VPRISHFNGITIRMFFNESIHSGRPHFHASYGGAKASFDATNLSRLSGRLPRRIERLVRTWARMNKAQLLANRERGRAGSEFETIEPLK